MATNLEELELIEINKLRRNIEIIKGLPHLHGQKMYPWQRKIFESRNRLIFCTAANQVGKSSILIKKCIHWATSPDLWPSLWNTTPRQFWYLYPDYGTATREFESKWEPEFLPRGKFKDDPQYGWNAEFEKKEIKAIRFNTGVTVYFMAYAQMARMLQASTVHAMFCFPEGHTVITKTGQRDIKDIEVGEYVLGMSGEWNRVERRLSREAKTIRIKLLNGTEIEATPEHPFWVNGFGWKQFSDLQTGDVLVSTSQCQKAYVSFLTALTTIATRTRAALPPGITTKIKTIRAYIPQFGNLFTESWFPRGMLSTIKITIHSITEWKTWNYFQIQPILAYTANIVSPELSIKNTCVPHAEKLSSQEPSTDLRSKAAQTSVAVKAGAYGKIVKFVASAFYLLESTNKRYVAQSALVGFLAGRLKKIVGFAERCLRYLLAAPTKPNFVACSAVGMEGSNKTVYNITVSGDHTYYVNNIATHNCDEEINSHLFPELRFRLMAVGGYFASAFTATLGQEFFRSLMEDRGPDELFPDALKMQIDLERDCRFFEDGTPSHWTEQAVQEAIAACPTEAEVLRRIRGRFVVTEGRRYPSFSRARNVRPPETDGAPPDWLIFAGVDLGSGSDRGHPSAITFVAVRPDFSFGRVFKHWNGRGVSTTASDTFQKFLEMRGKMRCVHQCYDYSAKDFGTIAQRAGEAFSQAKKDRQLGDNILNSLFRNQMLVIDDIPENYPLIKELERANENDRKTMAHDDSCDSARYCVAPIAWDWCFLNPELNTPPPDKQILTPEQERRKFALVGKQTEDEDEPFMRGMDEEISFWQNYLDA